MLRLLIIKVELITFIVRDYPREDRVLSQVIEGSVRQKVEVEEVFAVREGS
jgi:hypothetical protein